MATFTLPVYDNIELEGNPVARLRGSYIADPAGGFTASTSLYFFATAAYLGVDLSFSDEQPDDLVSNAEF